MELYKQYRPKRLEDVLGQSNAINVLQKKIDTNNLPHAILLSGPSGIGKTTIARCLRKPLKCSPKYFHELNIADIRGIDNIRDIRRIMMSYPLEGQTKIWLLDEVAELTAIAQKALLKMLEDTPEHVYFILATTDPQKLIKAIQTRCTHLRLRPLKDDHLSVIIDSILLEEDKQIDSEVKDKIIECSEGSARKALVLLDAILPLESKGDMLEAIEKSTQEKQTIELCRLLLNPRTNWSSIGALLKDLAGEEPEGLRRMVLGYMRSCLLGGSKIAPRSHYIMTCFERNFFDTGHAGLAIACWEAMNNK